MITFSKLGRKGNLGNQMFQIASCVGLADRYGHHCGFPKWSYAQYFKNDFPILHKDEYFEVVKEKEYNHHDWNLKQGNYDLDGWLQSEKYFNVEKTREIFQFADFAEDLFLKYNFLFSRKTILLSVRRGDFVGHPVYYQLTHSFYLKAIIENFPDWEERNIVFTSDNMQYCKYHFSFLKNSFFLDGLSGIEQLALGTKCDDFIISNSTFSWWIAWLGEKQSSKVVRPLKNFRGDFANINNDVDYFPERWSCFDDKEYAFQSKFFSFRLKGIAYEFLVGIKIILLNIKAKMRKKLKDILKRD